MNAPILKPEALCQVGFVVHDVEATAKKYAAAFGLPMPKIIETPGYEKAKTIVDGKPSEATAKLAFFQTGQLVVELIQPNKEPSAWRNHLDEHGEGVHHIAFGTPDVVATTEAATGTGVRALYPDPRRGTSNSSINFLHPKDCHGVLTELVQSADPGTAHHQH